MFYHLILLVLFALAKAIAFTTSSLTTPSTINTALYAAEGRRAFVQGVASASFFSTLMPAFATEDIDDLAMPTEDEDAKAKEVRYRQGNRFLRDCAPLISTSSQCPAFFHFVSTFCFSFTKDLGGGY